MAQDLEQAYERFRSLVAELTALGNNAFMGLLTLTDQNLQLQKDSEAQSRALQAKIDEVSDELASCHEALDSQALQLAEARKANMAQGARIEKLSDSVAQARHDSDQIAALTLRLKEVETQRDSLQQEVETLRVHLEREKAVCADALEVKNLEHQNALLQLEESLRVALDKQQGQNEWVRHNEELRRDLERTLAAEREEHEKVRRVDKADRDKLNMEVQSLRMTLAESRREVEEGAKNLERQVHLATKAAESREEHRVAALNREIAERDRQLDRLNHRLKAQEDDHRRALEELRTQFSEELNRQAEAFRARRND